MDHSVPNLEGVNGATMYLALDNNGEALAIYHSFRAAALNPHSTYIVMFDPHGKRINELKRKDEFGYIWVDDY